MTTLRHVLCGELCSFGLQQHFALRTLSYTVFIKMYVPCFLVINITFVWLYYECCEIIFIYSIKLVTVFACFKTSFISIDLKQAELIAISFDIQRSYVLYCNFHVTNR